MDAHSGHDDIRSHVKTYYMVFGALMVLTCLTSVSRTFTCRPPGDHRRAHRAPP